jgi:hypothetical protein
MNCSFPSGCAFAVLQMANLEARLAQYASIRAATERAEHKGVLEPRVAHEDYAVLDKKMREAAMKMTALTPCVVSR